ncbi:hypothetical protein V5799_000568 [Amblyomma americanum]|uniref:Uncharacterized protein n=1 Tax=Amblyomma americanum TaxID=6943 RepID=A0AAQ4D2P1_AMBAM
MLGELFKSIKVKIVEPPSGHRPPSCPSMMARSFRIHARLASFSGCFFIRDLFSTRESAAPRVVWKSWYTVYSCVCLAFLVWIQQGLSGALLRQLAEPEDQFQSGLRLSVQIILFLRMTASFICMVLSSSRLVTFHQRASAFEKEIGLLACHCCAPRRFFWSDIRRGCLCVLFCVGLAITGYNTVEWPNATADSALALTYKWTKILITHFACFTYDNIYAAALRSSCQVLSEYLGKQLSLLKDCMNSHVAWAHHAEKAARVEEIRLHLSTVRQLKEEINDIWRWPLVISSLCVLVVPCLCVHEACQADFVHRKRYRLFLYCAYITYEFISVAYASQSVINKNLARSFDKARRKSADTKQSDKFKMHQSRSGVVFQNFKA